MRRSLLCLSLLSLTSLLVLPRATKAQDNTPPSVLDQPFAKINGETITYREYIRTLERQNVVVPNGQTTNALRLVIDQMIGNRIILSEAARLKVLPSEDDVNGYYQVQKRLFENQYPGKSYEESITQQGTTAGDVKSDMRVQLAEANLYAQKLDVKEKDVHEAYDKAHGDVGLPVRVQIRLVLVAPDSEGLKKAQALFKANTPFEDVARQVDPPQLQATSGLMPQLTPVSAFGENYQNKVEKLPVGSVFGPVDFKLAADQPLAKAWVKIETRIPALVLSYEDARPIIEKQIVMQKLADPANQKARQEVIALKLKAAFEPVEPDKGLVWEQLRKNAVASGLAPAAAEGGKTAP